MVELPLDMRVDDIYHTLWETSNSIYLEMPAYVIYQWIHYCVLIFSISSSMILDECWVSAFSEIGIAPEMPFLTCTISLILAISLECHGYFSGSHQHATIRHNRFAKSKRHQILSADIHASVVQASKLDSDMAVRLYFLARSRPELFSIVVDMARNVKDCIHSFPLNSSSIPPS